MTVPQFTFDAETNAYLSEPFTVDEQAMVHIELASRAPVVTLKKEKDGGYANYGQTPKSGEAFEINITTNREELLMLATPVEVTKCYILN
jgi:hypothetical protein